MAEERLETSVTPTGSAYDHLRGRSIRYALTYARMGWPVFPLWPGLKKPRTRHGLKDATLSEQQIRRWWMRWPLANVGIRTGNGLVVLDVDPSHEGVAALDELLRRNGGLPLTPTVVTGGQGRHYYFSASRKVRNSAGKLGPGLDIRGENGYVVAPPSLHESGRRYRWETIPLPPLAPVPDWLGHLDDPSDSVADISPKFGRLPAEIPEGSRNTSLTSIAGSLRYQGLPREEIERALGELNTKRCKPPLPHDEVASIAASVSRYKPGESRQLEMLRAWYRTWQPQTRRERGDWLAFGAMLQVAELINSPVVAPSERRLATMTNREPKTVRNALMSLADAGRIRKERNSEAGRPTAWRLLVPKEAEMTPPSPEGGIDEVISRSNVTLTPEDQDALEWIQVESRKDGITLQNAPALLASLVAFRGHPDAARVYWHLEFPSRPKTASRLAVETGISVEQVRRDLRWLGKQRLAASQSSSTDRRVKEWSRTTYGELLGAASPNALEAASRLHERIDEERRVWAERWAVIDVDRFTGEVTRPR
jgi:hypothetical protein